MSAESFGSARMPTSAPPKHAKPVRTLEAMGALMPRREKTIDKVERLNTSAGGIKERLSTMKAWMESGKRAPKELREGLGRDLNRFKLKTLGEYGEKLRKEVSTDLGWPTYNESDEDFYAKAFEKADMEMGPRLALAHESMRFSFTQTGESLKNLLKDPRLISDESANGMRAFMEEAIAGINSWKSTYPEAGENGRALLRDKTKAFVEESERIEVLLKNVITEARELQKTYDMRGMETGATAEEITAASVHLDAVIDAASFAQKHIQNSRKILGGKRRLERYTRAVRNKAAHDAMNEAYATVTTALASLPENKGMKTDRSFARKKKDALSAPEGTTVH